MIIGLTGVYCAGKNHVAAILEKRGFPVLDVDKLGHLALETEKQKVFSQFGSGLEKSDGSLDKRLLGQLVFGNPEKLAALEAIVHPEANRLTEEWIAAQKGHCVVNAALLHKSSVFNRLNRIILVTAPFLTRVLRARRRDKLLWVEILKRFASQKVFYNQYLVNANAIYAEIYRVKNPGLNKTSISGAQNQKLECQIDKILEGIV
ncbi:MAG: dephospho-CoA kinase [Treponema sp.]|jgi:dephospho-CoA kinase|nr:dephospho-CoA kinase [Treponema sp.]